MSNFLSIATVTAALVQVLGPAAANAVPGATVTNARPDNAGAGTPSPRANVYLYQVTPNAAWRNRDLPMRSGDGQVVQRPRAARDLHYLITFYGDEGKLEPQRLLGSVVRKLHADPVLTRQIIRNTIASPTFPFLAASNLADDVELVKFTPLLLSLEELSKLWAVFFQTQYALSVAYQGTVVLIEGDETPGSPLPVLERMVYVVPFRYPLIEQVMSQAGPNQPILAGDTLVIAGKQLRGDVTQVRIGGGAPITPPVVGDTQISVPLTSPPLPAGSLRAGVQGVQVVQSREMGKPPVPHAGDESNVAAFVLSPTITKDGQGNPKITITNRQVGANNLVSATVTVGLDPLVGAKQRAALLLNRVKPPSDPQPVYRFDTPPRNQDDTSIAFSIGGVEQGDYFVRVQVDGAESPLDLDTDPNSPTFHLYIGPKVTI